MKDNATLFQSCLVNINRPGLGAVLAWLEESSDFFEAPASTRFHGAKPGGLARHSIDVYYNLRRLVKTYTRGEISEDSVALVALLHDVCKVDFYKPTTKRQKGQDGVWRDVPGYIVEDKLPMGHGEKSLYLLLQHGLELTDEEAAAIRWHMGPYADKDQINTMSAAFDRYPLALFLHMADMITAHYTENEEEKAK